MRKIIILFITTLFFSSCKDERLPKPKAFLALEYPSAQYELYDNSNCTYRFEKNDIARVVMAKGNIPCWVNLEYPILDATVFITYQPVNNNLDSLLQDAQKLPLQHTIKADFIEGDIYTNSTNKVFGMFYEVEGNAASQAQFYITDSIKHFITGSLYFNQRPNYDSIMPAAAYLKKDMKHLMETMQWEE